MQNEKLKMKKIINKILVAVMFSIVNCAFLIASPAYAGTDLAVNCYDNGPCDISPANTPLFAETNILPGDRLYQRLTIQNYDVNDTCELVLDVSDASPVTPVNLAEQIFAAISDGTTTYAGSLVGGHPQAGFSYQNLYDSPPISLGSLAPFNSRIYTWYAEFDFDAGNEYQRSQTIFDFEINIACDGGGTTPTTSGGGSTSGGTSAPGPASPPRCEDEKPNGAPSLSATITGPNSVLLNWTPVSPVTHYALEFYRISDNEHYGSVNIGNVTSFTVDNLSGGGASYRFQVIPVNGCMPGDRSNETVVTPTGRVTVGRPTGGGQVLGVIEPEVSPTPELAASPAPEGQVLGESTCLPWKFYLPWILLIAQLVLILGADYYFRKDEGWTKQYLMVGITIISIVLFYLFRSCPCYADAWWLLLWLCKWYWLVSLLLSALLQAINYAFIEQTVAAQKELEVNQNKIEEV